MALTQTFVGHNVVGVKREDYVQATFTGVTSGIIKTRLHRIESVTFQDVSGNDMVINVYPNSATASATEDDPGQCFVNNTTSNEVYIVRAIGW